MRDEELAAAAARHAERARSAGGEPRGVTPPGHHRDEGAARDERLARARAAESTRTRRAGDEVLARSTGRAALSITEVDRQARQAWSQIGSLDVDADARLALAAAIHASRAATMARQRRDSRGER